MNARNKARLEKAKKLNLDGFECAKCKGKGTQYFRGHACTECNGRGHFVIIKQPKRANP